MPVKSAPVKSVPVKSASKLLQATDLVADLLIVGGGVLGLWAAKYAADAGMRVVLIDKKRCGSGGSRGLLGALAPHLPNATNEKKRFQLHALDELPGLVAELEEQSGLSANYGQTGRLMPIRVPGFQKRVERCILEAPMNWQLGRRSYQFEQVDAAQYEGWVNPELASLGLAFDNLSARVVPRSLMQVLFASVMDRIEIIEDCELISFDRQARRAALCEGRMILADKIVLSAGFETYELLKPLVGSDLGHGVKGHSSLFELDGVSHQPSLYDNGVYVVPHADGTVAVGSSSQNEWSDEHGVDEGHCMPYIERAKELCPALRGGRFLTHWAGVRPRSFAKEPIVGALDERGDVHVLTGGFKISFGIAHRLAQAFVERLLGSDQKVSLPASYKVSYHLEEAKKTSRGGE